MARTDLIIPLDLQNLTLNRNFPLFSWKTQIQKIHSLSESYLEFSEVQTFSVVTQRSFLGPHPGEDNLLTSISHF